MGRQPKPASIHKANGNPSQRPIPKEPKAKLGIPTCPKKLSPHAKKIWKRVTKDLNTMQLLYEVDTDLIATYCQTVARWWECEEIIQAEGVTTLTKDGIQKTHPAAAMQKELSLVIKSLGGDLGLSVIGRARMGRADFVANPLDPKTRGRKTKDKRGKLLDFIDGGRAA